MRILFFETYLRNVTCHMHILFNVSVWIELNYDVETWSVSKWAGFNVKDAIVATVTRHICVMIWSLLCGSTSLIVLLYAVLHCAGRQVCLCWSMRCFTMSNVPTCPAPGALQTAEFFGYMMLACYAFSLMLGAVSFFSSLWFIRYIYVNIKVDWKTSGAREEDDLFALHASIWFLLWCSSQCIYCLLLWDFMVSSMLLPVGLVNSLLIT